jgi:hypothetical protein
MSQPFSIRAFSLGLVLLLVPTAVVHAQANYFKIINVHSTSGSDDIKVGSSWRKDLPHRVQVTLMVTADMPSNGVFVKAYFYNKDNKLVASYPRPNPIWASTVHGMEEVSLPRNLTHGKIMDVYFALPEDLQAKHWTTVLVVFGDKGSVAATALPNTALPMLDFPEKAQVATPPPQ